MGGFRDPIPSRLRWLNESERGRRWLAGLPRAVDASAEHWRLRLEEPYPYAFTSLVVPARREDGSEAVLKILYVDRETECEPDALRHWQGDGAVRLLDEIPEHHALLLERCVPGTALSGADPEVALTVIAGLLPRLWKPAASPPFRPLGEEAAHWAGGLEAAWDAAGRPFSRKLLDAALDAMRTLPGTQGEAVLLHQDLHGGNVLAAQREPWLVIDPKPLVGEREFGLAPIIRSTELGPTRRDVLRRLDRLTSGLGLDRERSRSWCVAQTIAWSIGSDILERNVQVAEWLLEG